MSSLNLVPLPVSVDLIGTPPFALDDKVVIVADPAATEVAEVAAKVLSQTTGLTLPVASTSEGGDNAREIRLVLPPQGAVDESALDMSDEAYRLEVTSDLVTLSATTPRGLNWALATLRQLVTPGEDGGWVIPAVLVEDVPRFPWRGLSMDVVRSFYTVDEVKTVVDLLATYKMNTLHLHLTDDQGWRLEIPGREALTEISGVTAGAGGDAGFYTVEEFADIQAYAAARGVTVVPEFDLPGHTNAATHVYGELTPSGEPTPAYDGAKVGFSKLYPDLPATEPFLRDVINSMAEQTVGPYIHIGGDEALEMDLGNYNELVTMAEKIARETGKRPVAWQEAAGAGLPGNMIYQFWDPRLTREDMAKAVSEGGQLLLSPANHVYFDMQYDADTPHGQDWSGYVELRDSYEWDPVTQVEGIPEEDVVGVEATVWTEYIHGFDAMTYMLLPRLAAAAEVGWSARRALEWESVAGRIAPESALWNAMGVNWHRSPGVDWK